MTYSLNQKICGFLVLADFCKGLLSGLKFSLWGLLRDCTAPDLHSLHPLTKQQN